MLNLLSKDNTTILPIDECQVMLSEQYIKPNAERLFSYLYNLRNELDAFIYQINTDPELLDLKNNQNQVFLKTYNTLHKNALKKYPIGACFQITSMIHAYINYDIKRNHELVYLKDFIEDGGILKKIWGQQYHLYFQTAMQFGSYYVDVANDTVDITKPKIEIKCFEDSCFYNISTLQEFCKIKELYHGVQIYPNLYYPEFALTIPYFYEKSAKLILPYNPYIIPPTHNLKNIIRFYAQKEYLAFKELHDHKLREVEAFFNILRRDKSISTILRFEYFTGENWDIFNNSKDKNTDKNFLDKICIISKLFNNRHLIKHSNN